MNLHSASSIAGPALWLSVTVLMTASPSDAQVTVRLSLDALGGDVSASSRNAQLSANGRFVVFESVADDLVAGDTNGAVDVFVRDRWSGAVERVSVSSAGLEGDFTSSLAAISGDGRWVAFQSLASNLVPGDLNGTWDLFLHDRELRTTRRASEDASGIGGDGPSGAARLSSDGQFVAFESAATNLVPSDGNGATDVFVREIATWRLERVSVSASGVEGNDDSYMGGLSMDASNVSFWSRATNLVQADTNGEFDVFVRDRLGGSTQRVSVAFDGSQAEDGSDHSALSHDGRVVVFASRARNLVPGDNNRSYDIFVRDLEADTTVRVSVDENGREFRVDSTQPSISADGRFVAFQVWFDDSAVYRHDRESGALELASVNSDGIPADNDCYQPRISSDGRQVCFHSVASNLDPTDTNQASDVFARGGAITLEAFPSEAPIGSSVEFLSFGAQVASRGVLILRDISGLPWDRVFARLGFDDRGSSRRAVDIPNDPALRGLEVGLTAVALAPGSNRLEESNRVTLTLR